VFPEIIEDQVHSHQPKHHNDGHQFSFESNSDHADQSNSNDISDYFKRAELQVHETQKH